MKKFGMIVVLSLFLIGCGGRPQTEPSTTLRTYEDSLVKIKGSALNLDMIPEGVMPNSMSELRVEVHVEAIDGVGHVFFLDAVYGTRRPVNSRLTQPVKQQTRSYQDVDVTRSTLNQYPFNGDEEIFGEKEPIVAKPVKSFSCGDRSDILALQGWLESLNLDQIFLSCTPIVGKDGHEMIADIEFPDALFIIVLETDDNLTQEERIAKRTFFSQQGFEVFAMQTHHFYQAVQGQVKQYERWIRSRLAKTL